MRLYLILIILVEALGYLKPGKNIYNNFLNFLKDINTMNEKVLTTTLDDNYRGLFLKLRQESTQQDRDMYKKWNSLNRQQGKLQPQINEQVPFPCDLNNTRSTEVPISVHRLRPGDIDIVASIGDSLSAGNGILAESFWKLLTENRGLTFAGGGQGTWRTILTLPNILKVFNNNLYGYATTDSLAIDKASHLNIAEPMIMSRDLPYQAEVLIKRMRRDANINMEKNWKVLTIFVGSNDICSDMCHHKEANMFLEAHGHDLRKALTILRDSVPRMLVNLISVPNLETSLFPISRKSNLCHIMYSFFCHCLFSSSMNLAQLNRAKEIITRWQRLDEEISGLSEFNTVDFAVVYQPLTTNITVPVLPNGEVDMRFFTADCFHFSQLGHASVANTLWNNMLQNVGTKAKSFMPAFHKIICPTAEQPYIVTLHNSNANK